MLDNVVSVANDGAFADAAKRYILINALNVFLQSGLIFQFLLCRFHLPIFYACNIWLKY